MLKMTPQEVIICHVKGPHLAEVVSLGALFAILFGSDCLQHMEENKVYRLCDKTETQQKTKSKSSDIFKETMTNYDNPTQRV